MYIETVIYLIISTHVPKCQRIPCERTENSKLHPFSPYLLTVFDCYCSNFTIITMMTPTLITTVTVPRKSTANTASEPDTETGVTVCLYDKNRPIPSSKLSLNITLEHFICQNLSNSSGIATLVKIEEWIVLSRMSLVVVLMNILQGIQHIPGG